MNSTKQSSPMSQYSSRELTTRDQELLLAAREGSHAAFATLRSLHARRLYQQILSMTKNHEDAEDVLQETFLNAYRALPSFEGRCRFSSWLTRIAINSTLMVLRKRRNRPEVSFEHQPGGEDDSPLFEPRDSAPSPEELYGQHQRREAVLRTIQRLDPKARSAMNILILQDKSVREAASNLGVSPASVKSRVHRARKRLAQSSDLRAHGASPASRGAASRSLDGTPGTRSLSHIPHNEPL